MILTTSHTIEGHTITEYLGVVSAASLVSLMAGPKQMTVVYQKCVDDALSWLSKSAENMGADGVISIQISRQKADLMAYGTAVKFVRA